MTRTAFLIGLFVLPLVAANPAHANGSDGHPSGLGLGGRYSHVTNRDTEEGTHMGGVVARARSEFVGFEGAVDYRKEDLAADVDLKTWPATFSLLLYPIPTIYGLAGVGWYNSTLDFPSESGFEDRTASDFGYHLGAGIEVPVGESVSLTGDFRYHFIDQEFNNAPLEFGKVDEDAFALNAGILFYLR